MLKLRSVPIETAIIERYRRRESLAEEALMEMVPGPGRDRPEAHLGRRGVLRQPRDRGLTGVQLASSDERLRLVEAVAETFPKARWQRCAFHFCRSLFTIVAKRKFRNVSAMRKAIDAQENLTEALSKARSVETKLVSISRRIAH